MSNRWTDGSEDERRRNRREPRIRGHRCEMCGGSGRVPGIVKVTGKGSGMGSNYGPCPECGGLGVVDVEVTETDSPSLRAGDEDD